MGPDAITILQLLADPDRAAIVRELLDCDATQKQLGHLLELSSAAMSRHMRQLEDAGLVHRERSHGPYRLLFRQQVWAVLQSAADLARDQTAERARLAAEDAAALRRLGMRGRRRDVQARDG